MFSQPKPRVEELEKVGREVQIERTRNMMAAGRFRQAAMTDVLTHLTEQMK